MYVRMSFWAFGNFSMLLIDLVLVLFLRGCYIIAISCLYKCENVNVKSICYYVRC